LAEPAFEGQLVPDASANVAINQPPSRLFSANRSDADNFPLFGSREGAHLTFCVGLEFGRPGAVWTPADAEVGSP
jgi:hypothetical protein